jgi:Lon protease-like protein
MSGERREIPLFPLGTVLFPGGLLPLRIFEQRYLQMAKRCLKDETPFGVCLIREGAEVGAPATPEPVGCLARIQHWDMQQLGLLQIVAQGTERFRVHDHQVQADGLVLGSVEMLPEAPDVPVPERFTLCRELLERIAAEHGEDLFAKPFCFDSSAWVGARLAEVLPLPVASRQRLLEFDDPLMRLGVLQQLLAQNALGPKGSAQS